jgi:hypothetical protein
LEILVDSWFRSNACGATYLIRGSLGEKMPLTTEGQQPIGYKTGGVPVF